MIVYFHKYCFVSSYGIMLKSSGLGVARTDIFKALISHLLTNTIHYSSEMAMTGTK